ncbi:glycosyltransferase [Marivirga arenosa]|jgi:glycosyltransferase involved in cell wall biosynthesis|uniref:Glycosyltransferase n=1 Tax=Marivirga arenosa TaxID=3059076 RepID=A0AA51N9K6_9BACT|nr:glycosyltransferase [Marivirga sp. ABR2-2]WMN07021.1 glycosyltransferase [Marivirga sp. ABR2-2]
MSATKVTVICLCYNQEEYVVEAMQSVLNQTYPTELIIVDDASTDKSVEVIKSFLKNQRREIKSIFLNENHGNCKAFNIALKECESDYIIDLAADDVLLPHRVEEGVKNLKANRNVAVNFTNANYIDQNGEYIKSHFEVDDIKRSKEIVPEGDCFAAILERYYICSPSMMYNAKYLKEIGGYDESLAYEDFDIMLRLSRKYPFSYTDKILVNKRILNNSMSANQYQKDNKQLNSTLIICRKAFKLIKERKEKVALIKRIAYEAKQAFVNKRFILFISFINLEFKTILQK